MIAEELENQTLKQVRASRTRKQGVEYKLRVIPRSDGLLELVEVQPKLSRFHEWARHMQYVGWHM